jgi:hypothetical protein
MSGRILPSLVFLKELSLEARREFPQLSRGNARPLRAGEGSLSLSAPGNIAFDTTARGATVLSGLLTGAVYLTPILLACYILKVPRVKFGLPVRSFWFPESFRDFAAVRLTRILFAGALAETGLRCLPTLGITTEGYAG